MRSLIDLDRRPPERAASGAAREPGDPGPSDPGSGDPGSGAPAAKPNAGEVSVSELSSRIKRAMEDAFGHVRVRGELGRVSRPRSGHIYLDIKDDRAVLAGVVWRGVASGLKIQPEEGLEVVAEGRITTYAGQSKYQLVIESLAPAGAGALMAMLEARRKALEAEGLFATERKQPIPFLPEVVGVVTSPSGAVIRDILHRLSDRFPRRVLLWPVAVQGEASAGQVAAAIRGFNALAPDGAVPRPDVLIVARGGGSIEDLWGFNDEAVVRAAAESAIPLISAVGHETDTTLIDFAADRRAPTPTAAAEMAVPVRTELLASLSGLEERRLRALGRLFDDRRGRLRDLARALPRADALTGPARQRFDYGAERLPRALRAFTQLLELRLGRAGGRLAPSMLRRRLEEAEARLSAGAARLGPALERGARLARERFDRGRFADRLRLAAARDTALRRERVEQLGRLLAGFSYKATLARGYAAVRGADGLIARAGHTRPNAEIEIEFADGRVAAVTAGSEAGSGSGSGSGAKPGAGAARGGGAAAKKKARSNEPQGSLF